MTAHSPTMHDYTSRQQAQALADKLNAYWHEQGHHSVQHWIEAASIKRDRKRLYDQEVLNRHINGYDTVWIVRSNLINGMPPK